MVAFLKRSWIDRWRRRPAGDPAQPGQGGAEAADPLLQAGERLRQAREQRGLTLRQLADQTRISTAVLEALERGWRDRLPEPAYLRSMLPLLERFLELEPSSLRAALLDGHSDRQRNRAQTVRLPWLSVQLFSTWQGSALYGALLLLLIYVLNLEQQRLAAQGLLALRPVSPRQQSAQRQQLPVQGADLLVQTYPELQPLGLAGRGQALALLQRQEVQQQSQQAPGVLELSLNRATRMRLETASGLASQLQVGPGELQLPLTPPFSLELDPPRPGQADSLRWNGLPLLPVAPGRYGFPRPAAAASSP